MAYTVRVQYLIDKILELEKFMSDSEFEVVENIFNQGTVSHTQHVGLNELFDSLLERKKNLSCEVKYQLWN